MQEQFIHNFVKAFSVPCSYHRMIPATEDGVFDVVFLCVNPFFEVFFNIKAADILGKTIREMDCFDESAKEQWIQECNRVVTRNISFNDIRFQLFQDKDIKINVLPLKAGSFLITYEELTDYNFKQIHADDFFDANIELMCIVDFDSRFIKVNDRFEDVLGFTREEFENGTILDFIHTDDIEKTRNAAAILKARKSIASFTNRYCDKQGSYHTIEWKVQLHGKYLYCTGRDITEARKIHEDLAIKTKELEAAYNRLEDLSVKDHMTGLYNRMYFDSRILVEMERADKYKTTLSMFVFDLDFFKRINDKFGHPVGDSILTQYAEVFKKNTRREEFACRIGGEEFALVMPDTPLSIAEQIADRVRKAFENMKHPVAGRVTASFGVAEKKQGESFDDWYKRIDRALYAAKNHGRNRVMIYRGEMLPESLMDLEWENRWTSGNKKIDLQHKELLELVIKIQKNLTDRVSFDEIMVQIGELKTYIAFHFKEEETIIRKAGYQKWKEHHKIHEALLAEMEHKEMDFLNSKCKASAFFQFLLYDIITGHLIEEDTKFFYLFQEEKE